MRSFPAKETRRARIEIIPMIDVMMFLLVFFVLISINVLPALGLKINVPSSGQPDKIIEKVRVTVGIDREGATSLDGVLVRIEDLPARLRAAAQDKSLSVIVTGDENVALQKLVHVMDAVKSAGISSLQIVTRSQ